MKIYPTLFNLRNFSLLKLSKLPSKNKPSNIFALHFVLQLKHSCLFSSLLQGFPVPTALWLEEWPFPFHYTNETCFTSPVLKQKPPSTKSSYLHCKKNGFPISFKSLYDR